jgi:hypothetical protein
MLYCINASQPALLLPLLQCLSLQLPRSRLVASLFMGLQQPLGPCRARRLLLRWHCTGPYGGAFILYEQHFSAAAVAAAAAFGGCVLTLACTWAWRCAVWRWVGCCCGVIFALGPCRARRRFLVGIALDPMEVR